MNNNLANPNFRDGKCPNCGVYNTWGWNNFVREFNSFGCLSYCQVCQEYIIYYNEELIYPKLIY